MTFKNLKEYCKEQYGKEITLDKKKQVCPKCGHKTLCLYGENLEQGKCFHPNCNLHLNLNFINKGTDYLSIVANRFFEHSKGMLLSKGENNEYCRAYLYAVNDRKINPSILERSDVGANDVNYDVSSKNKDLLDEIENKIKEEQNEKELDELNKKQQTLKNTIESVQNFIKANWNCILFFYKDSYGRITRIKARKPYLDNKAFSICKIRNEVAGIFNYNLFCENKPKSKTKRDENLLVFEGEFDQLTFATWAYENTCPILSCSIGGANGDIETPFKITSGAVCIIYDNDEAGISVLEKAKKEHTVFSTTTPAPYKDIDEYIDSFEDKTACRNAIISLLNSAKLNFRDYKGIKAQITRIMKFSAHNLEKCQAITNIIIIELLKRGAFYKDNNFTYIFTYDSKRIIPIESRDEQLKLLLNRMGVNAAKDYYNYVVNEIQTYAFDNGKKIKIHDFCYYDWNKNILYLFNNDDIVYKITTDNIEEIENGDDGIMFNFKNCDSPFTLCEIDSSTNYLEKYILGAMNLDVEEGGITKEEYQILIQVWFLGTFFESIMPSKVLLAAVGEKGSGKTSILRRLGILLFGESFNSTPLPNTADDFDTIVTNRHFILFDNVDTGKPWLNDKLASIATGQTIEKRKKYSDNQSLKFPCKTFLALTSRTPVFSRDDVADRLICVPFKRFFAYKTEDEVIKDTLEHRNEIMTYIVREIQKILKAIVETKNYKYETTFRIADFAIFGLRLFDYLGGKEKFENIINKVCKVQKEFAIEEDSLVYMLKIFAKKQNKPHKMSGFELYKQLLYLANEDNFDIPEFRNKYKSVKSFTRRIANIKSNIANDVKITIYKERANQKSYQVELVDKDFELPATNNSLFENAMDKAQNIMNLENNNGGENDK